VNYYRLKGSRLALVSVSLAGCVVNIFIATLALFLLHALGINIHSVAGLILLLLAEINIILGSLNLIPIPPLDGSRVLITFLPPHLQMRLQMIEPYGFFILVFLLITGLLRPILIFLIGIILNVLS
jgi:Zn-dependent protease